MTSLWSYPERVLSTDTIAPTAIPDAAKQTADPMVAGERGKGRGARHSWSGSMLI
jgi:hypothetical protein